MELLHHRYILSCKKHGRKTAVIDKALNKEVTYDKMLIGSLILRIKFTQYPDKYLGIMLPTSAGCMLSIVGALMCGKIPVMINYATGCLENSRYAMDKCRFGIIITSRKLLEKLDVQPVEGMVFLEDIMAGITLGDKLRAAVTARLPYPLIKSGVYDGSPSDISVILFTSGSEKEPKAVQLSHRNILHNIDGIPRIADLSEKDTFLAILPLFHVFGLTVDFWLPILLGAMIVTYPNPLDYKTVCGLVRDYRVSFMAATPSFFYGYLQRSEKGDFSSVRLAIAGADKLPHNIYKGYQYKHGIKVFEGYGTTETSPVISTNTPQSHKPGSIGRPIPNVQIKILDIETDKELGVNQEGKLLVKGDLVMEGYLGDLEETSYRIRNGWYDTGDIALLDEDGYLWHKGRLKRFVKVGGEMVSLVKVEEELCKLLPEDIICCVVSIPNPTKGADVVAAVATGGFNKLQVLDELAKHLPPIALPKHFYVIENIPMMPSGKVNFREVERLCREFNSNPCPHENISEC